MRAGEADLKRQLQRMVLIMFGLGVPELLIILVLILVLFGASKIPDLARSLGKGVSEFRKAQKEGQKELDKDAASAGVCPSCHAQVAADARFCPQCGKEQRAWATCPHCQNALGPGQKYCPKCGSRV